jgi:hypothetical protein
LAWIQISQTTFVILAGGCESPAGLSLYKAGINSRITVPSKCVLHDSQLYGAFTEARLEQAFVVLVYRYSTTVQLYRELNGPSKVCAPQISTKNGITPSIWLGSKDVKK